MKLKKKKGKKGNKKGLSSKSNTLKGTEVFDDRLSMLERSDKAKKSTAASRRSMLCNLEKERRFSKINKHKIVNQWRKIQRLNTTEYLRKEIEVMIQNHEREVDRKDAWIVLLDRDLDDSERQHLFSLRAHLQNIDSLIFCQDSRLLSMEREFENDLNILESSLNEEKENIRSIHNRDRNALLDLIQTVENFEAESEVETRQVHESFKEEIKNKQDEDTHMLRVTLESTIDELETHFESCHLNYLQNTDQRIQDFKRLTRKDKEVSTWIELKFRKIERLQKKIQKMKVKISDQKKENEWRNEGLLHEKQNIHKHYSNLKNNMENFRSIQKSRLKRLTKNVRASKTALEAKISKAEKILTLGEWARKMESEREKVLPFDSDVMHTDNKENETKDEMPLSPSLSSNQVKLKHMLNKGTSSTSKEDRIKPYQPFGIKSSSFRSMRASSGIMQSSSNNNPLSISYTSANHNNSSGTSTATSTSSSTNCAGKENKSSSSSNIPLVEAVAEEEYLDRFYKKYNKVLLDKLSLDKEKESLKQENSDLQDLLTQFLNGVSVNENSVNNDNSLLIINGRTNINETMYTRGGDITIVDASHMVNTQRVSYR